MYHGQWPKSAMHILGTDVNLGQCHALSVMVKNAESSLPVSYGELGRSLLTSDRPLSTLTSRPRWQVTAILTIRCPSWPVTATLTSRCPRWSVTVHLDQSLPTLAGHCHIDHSLPTLAGHYPR